ncbi:MAG: CAAD domain-containing protein [Cyanobacteria bacterium J06636_16]
MSTDLKTETTMPEPENTSVHSETTGSTYAGGEDVNQQFQQLWDKASGVLANLPEYVTDFFKEYKRPLVTVGLILTAFISVKLVLALLNAINEVPLLAPTFELIGLTYTGWFAYRFLFKDANRQELSENINSLKDQILGKRG